MIALSCPRVLADQASGHQPVALEDVAHGAVVTAAAQLQEVTLDPGVSPSRVLAGQEKDSVLALGALTR
jgi:hypothetical protein